MSEFYLVVIFLAVVFLVLAIIALYRFDSVKQYFKAYGFQIGISGERKTQGAKDKNSAAAHDEKQKSQHSAGKATVKVRGDVSGSSMIAAGSGKGEISIGRDVLDSELRATSKKEANVKIEGNLDQSDVTAETTDD